MRRKLEIEGFALLVIAVCVCVFLLTSCGTNQIVAKNCEKYNGGYWLCEKID